MTTGNDTAKAIWVLAVTQTLGYACFYYIFAVLVVHWSADLGWSKPQLAMGPTIAILISGTLAPFMGRLIDRGYGRLLLTSGSLIGALALFFLAQAASRADYLMAWAILGVAQAAALYEVCFALLIRRMGTSARGAITRVTLVAGFASTIAFPAGTFLSDAYGWRGAVLVAAGVAILVLTPLNFYGTGLLRRGTLKVSTQEKYFESKALRAGLHSLKFWTLGLVLAALSLNHWMLIAFIIPLFNDLGASGNLAVIAASLIGPAQVFGRLALMRFDGTASNGVVMVLCLTAMFGGTFCLIIAGVAVHLIFVFALLQGVSVGVMTILRPVLISEVMGKNAYGAIAGSMQVMPLMAGAAAPLVGGVLFGVGGATALISTSALILTLGGLGVFWLRRNHV